MKPEDHEKAYEQYRDGLNWAIDRGVEESQRIIGLNISRAAVELLSLYLHKLNIIDMGFQINHRWFKTKKVSERFPDFLQKEEIIKKLVELELKTENLVYGKPKTKQEIMAPIISFNEVEKLLLRLIGEIKENEKPTE